MGRRCSSEPRRKSAESLGGGELRLCKRFRRDGHQTLIEDHTRLPYEREELAQFEAIECQWPLLFAYELVTACCEERWHEAWLWRTRLKEVSMEQGGLAPLPELYHMPLGTIDAKQRHPGSQTREVNRQCAAALGLEPLVARGAGAAWPPAPRPA